MLPLPLPLQAPILHPLSAEAPPLEPPPILLVATSDGALRAYAFGHLDRPGRAGLAAAALPVEPLPAVLPPAWAAALQVRGRAGRACAWAVASTQPSPVAACHVCVYVWGAWHNDALARCKLARMARRPPCVPGRMAAV